MSEPEDPFLSEEWEAFVRHALDELVPMMRDSRICLSVFDGTTPNVKMALQVGFMFLLDKPIIAIVAPGVAVPRKLALVADEIVEAGPVDDEAFQARLIAAIKRAGKRATP